MTLLDARPAALNLLFRPDNALTVTLEWPEDVLDGRTFVSTLDGVALGVAIAGDVMTITATAGQTEAAPEASDWRLTETTLGATDDVIVGSWASSDDPAARSAVSVLVTEDTSQVNVSVLGGAGGAAGFTVVGPSGDTSGVTDKAAIEAALSNGNVQLIEGVYTVLPNIEISDSDRWLRGVGGGATVVRTTAGLDKSEHPEKWGTIQVFGPLSNVRVSDLTVDGQRTTHSGTPPGHPMNWGEGVEIDGTGFGEFPGEVARDIHVERVTILNAHADGIDWDEAQGCSARDIRVDNCGGFGLHLATNSRRIRVDGAHITRPSQSDFRAGFDLGSELNMVSNVVVEDSGFISAQLSSTAGGMGNIAQNVICRGREIRVGGSRVVLDNFVIDGEDTAFSFSTGHGLRVTSGTDDAIITRGRILNTALTPEINAGATNVTISNCELEELVADSGTNTLFVACRDGATIIDTLHGLPA